MSITKNVKTRTATLLTIGCSLKSFIAAASLNLTQTEAALFIGLPAFVFSNRVRIRYHTDSRHRVIQNPFRSPDVLLIAARRRDRIRHVVHNRRNRAQVRENGLEVGVRHGGNILPWHRGQDWPRDSHVLAFA